MAFDGYSVVPISPGTYDEIRQVLMDAGLGDAIFDDDEGELIQSPGVAFRSSEQVEGGHLKWRSPAKSEAMHLVLSALAVKAGVSSERLLELLDEAERGVLAINEGGG